MPTEETFVEDSEEVVQGTSELKKRESAPEVSEDEDMGQAVLTPEEREKRRMARKPDVSHLKPAVVDGQLLVSVGDRVVVERMVSWEEGRWLDTMVYTVRSVNKETGILGVWDEERGHRGYVSFKSPHQQLFLVPSKGSVFKKKRVGKRVVSEE